MKRRAHFIKLYKRLGLPESASLNDLRQRYHHLASLYHPDKAAPQSNPNANLELFKETHAAYRELRRYHNDHGHLPLFPLKTIIHPMGTATHAHAGLPKDSRWSSLLLAVLTIFMILLIFFLPSQNQTTSINETANPDHFSKSSPLDAETRLSSQSISPQTPTNPTTPPVKLGMSMGETFELLGVPDATVGNQWFYGDSEVYFRGGLVAGWSNNPKSPINTDPSLPQRVTPTRSHSLK